MSDAINPDHYKRLPAEAIEIIEAMIAGAPDNKAAYLHGQAAKYDLRLWGKGKSLEDYLTDWQKHIWYALRLESHLLELIEKQKAGEQQKAADLQSLKDHPFGKLKEPAIKQPSTPEPPDGWRWLEVGEVIRKGDRYFKDHEWFGYDLWVGGKIRETDRPSVRRNRFEVGEKVIDFCGQVWEVEYIFDTGNRYRLKHKEVRDETYGNSLAPYIEDAT